MMRRWWIGGVMFLGVFGLVPTASARTIFDVPHLLGHTHYRFLPLPIVASDPAEGETYGVLPVVITLDERDELVSVLAGAFTYNSVTRAGGFANWILSPSNDEELRLFGGASARFYREASVDYRNRRWLGDRLNVEGHFLYLEDPFERFFGFGPRTPKSAESNFTSLLFRGLGEAQYTFLPNLSVVGQVEWSRMQLQPRAIDQFADTITAYGLLPEVQPANHMIYRAGVRYDSRNSTFFPTRGLAASAVGILSHEVVSAPTVFGGYELQTKFAWQPHTHFTTVGHWRWQQLFGDRIPFHLQSSLGGEKELRGFVARRFTDHHATVLNLEERILIKEWRIMGTNVAFTIDPFFNVGQVFRRFDQLHPRNWEPAGGVGFRMRASPAVLGRVDVAYSRDGPAVYTTLDYPF